MIVQRTFLGSRSRSWSWTGPWRIRVDTMAGGTSNRTIKNYMNSSSSSYPILTDWGDGTHTISRGIASHTYASDGDYIISHYSSDNFNTAYLKNGGHKNIVEVLDPFPRLPSVGDGFGEIFYHDDYLQTIPSSLFDNNADFITDLVYTFSDIKGGPLHIPAGLFKSLSKLTTITNIFSGSVLDYIPDGLFEGMTTITDADRSFQSVKASYSGNRIFAGCTGLLNTRYCFAHAVIPIFDDDTFNGCSGINEEGIAYTFTNLPATKSVGARTFANCTGIRSCYYNFGGLSGGSPELESIGDYTWQNCTALESTGFFLDEAPKLKTLPSHTFSGCTKLENISRLFETDGSSLGAMDLYLDNCIPWWYNYPSFSEVPDMTATTRRVIHIPRGCTVENKYPKKYTIVADR